MKNKLLKILIGIISFIISGIISVTIFRPILSSFTQVETVLDVLQIAFNIIVAIQLYRFALRYLLERDKGEEIK